MTKHVVAVLKEHYDAFSADVEIHTKHINKLEKQLKEAQEALARSNQMKLEFDRALQKITTTETPVSEKR